jgi:cell wall-associated NlpC family hydrolase
MSAGRRFLVGFVVAFCLAGAGTARGYHTNWVGQNCNYAAPTPTSYITRDGSIQVALYAQHEGYQWGGGCWNDNNVDDSPGDPTSDPNTAGEGPDCSGFVFKVWREALDTGSTAFHQWWRLRNVHGPYVAQEFMDAVGAPNYPLSKSAAVKMDAFAKTSHVGMIYATNATGSDLIIEALGESYGTNIWTRAYRANSLFRGVRRLGWSQ